MFNKMNIESFDFIEVCLVDLNGMFRGKILPQNKIASALNDGQPFYCGIQGFGLQSEVPEHEEVTAKNYGNGLLELDTKTLIKVPWLSQEFKVGRILSEMNWYCEKTKQYLPHEADPRFVARKALENLHNEGYSLFSSYEYEFQLYEKGTHTLVLPNQDVFCQSALKGKYLNYILNLGKHLTSAGIDYDLIHREFCHGQFEIPLSATFGIKAADNAMNFKSAAKEIGLDYDFTVSFMTKPFPNDGSNGGHYNFSLWTADQSRNVLFDEQEPHRLSKIGQYWLAGIMKHLPALTAIFSPTTNCYRRLGFPWTPCSLSWNVDDRLKAIRVKNMSESASYFENRLCSSSVNPHLCLAATVIAGLDGIKNQLALVPPCESVADLPSNLEEALQSLEKDEVVMKGLGMAGKWFIQIKRSTDISKHAGHDIKGKDEEEYRIERNYFLERI